MPKYKVERLNQGQWELQTVETAKARRDVSFKHKAHKGVTEGGSSGVIRIRLVKDQ